MSHFNQFGLHPELVQAVTGLGYTQPTPIQESMIPVMLSGADVIGQAQTGTGKTAAFALPILHNLVPDVPVVQALVLAPTRELALQVAKAFEDYAQHLPVRVLAVYGGQPYYRQIGALKKGVEIVVGTPGRLLDLIEKQALDLSQVSTVVLDEADEMLSMGFIEDIESILSALPATHQTALFSATLPAPIRRLADKYLTEPQSIAIEREHVTVDAIEQRYYLVNAFDKTAALTRLFEVEPITSALIFVRTRAASAELAVELTGRGFTAEVLNGDLEQEARERVLARFRQNQVKVLVATDVAARGLDIDDISHVFNYDLPEDPEIYVHRVGRTGRAGKTGIAISLATPAEKGRLRRIESFARVKLQQAAVPTEEEITAQREARLVDGLSVWLHRNRFKRERELVEKLAEEGFDPFDIAAAALRMVRAGEKVRPIAPISAVVERKLRGQRGFEQRQPHLEPAAGAPRPRRTRRNLPENVSHEEGMVRLSLDKGREHGLRVNDVVSTLAFYAAIPGSLIGKIHIMDRHTHVDVPQDVLGQVLARAETYKIRRQPVRVEVA